LAVLFRSFGSSCNESALGVTRLEFARLRASMA
jgi:hypothetical protein